MNYRGSGADLAIQDVDLDLADSDPRDDRSIGPGRSTCDDDASSEQLLRGEGHSQDVVNPKVECLELRRKVTAPSQPENRGHASGEAIRCTEPLEQGGTFLVIHVDYADVWTPRCENLLGLRKIRCRAHHE